MFTWEEWEDMEENYAAAQLFISEWLNVDDYNEEMFCYE